MKKGKERYLNKRLLSILLIFFFSLIFLNVVQSEESLRKDFEKKGHPKIESALTDLKTKYLSQGKGPAHEFTKRHRIRMDEQDRVIVFIQPRAGKKKETIPIETLKAYGVEIIKSGDTVIKAKVPISMIDVITDQVEGIAFIRFPDRPKATITSEGVNLTGASTYQWSGYNGQNVKVAVIDLGFGGLASAIANGDLPSSVIKIDCTGVNCAPTDFSSETESHGTGVAEVIYDMAPGAQLYLIKIDDNIDLMNAKDYCITNGIKVINHSVGWFNTNFYDGACYFDNAVCTANHAYRNGILWVNSAGNEARSHYGAMFNDRDGDTLHNVTENSNTIAIAAQANDVILAVLTWDAWPETDQDYDLLLYDSFMRLVEKSMSIQNGIQPPSEGLIYITPTAGTYHLAVRRSSATQSHRFSIFSYYHALNPYVESSSLVSPADATGVMAVAAIDYLNWFTGPQEDFSSQGPANDGRMKPEVSGPDGVSNFTYGFFFGTSASSPHVAGAAALILSAHPTANVSQLWNAITINAIDMGITGQDPIYGFGRLNLPPFNPVIYVYPNPVDFRDVFLGTTADQLVTLQNVGNVDLTIGTITSPATPFQIIGDSCSGQTLSFGANCTLTVRFSPNSGGSFNSSLIIPSNDPQKSTVTVLLNGNGINQIPLFLPPDQTSYNTCSLVSPPAFQWAPLEGYGNYEIQFSSDPIFMTVFVRIKVFGGKGGYTMTYPEWKKILSIPRGAGGTVYWRVVGASGNSDTRTIVVLPPGPVLNSSLSPVSKGNFPTLTWQNNCNVNFKVWFGRDTTFSKKVILSFSLLDPTANGGIFSRTLIQNQWSAIRGLVKNISGATIYWFVEARDGINRRTITELMSFILTD